MNSIQRRNQLLLVSALRKPVLITSLNLEDSRLLRLQTMRWEDYWDELEYVPNDIQHLGLAWHAFIESDYSARYRTPFVHAYFRLLRQCLAGYQQGKVSLRLLAKVIAFETLSVGRETCQSSAAIFSCRKSCILTKQRGDAKSTGGSKVSSASLLVPSARGRSPALLPLQASRTRRSLWCADVRIPACGGAISARQLSTY